MKIFERGFSLGKYNVSRFIGNVFCREYLKAPVQWHFHQLRHTFGFHHLSAGEPLEVVSDMMGHADISTTRDIYQNSSCLKGMLDVKGNQGSSSASG
ncbi:MAG: hypothetical protein AUK31_01725 [Fibrobacteres bacterium CG2_30_45_31]|nr:MAG: hypothetical protein AUK31_01725 [Fibrobacteres bacterium CG2_30_45_31]